MDKPLDILKIEAEIGKLMAETMKLNAEASKMIRERAWYPVVLMLSAVGATVALTKMLLS